MSFKIIAVRPLEGCKENILRNLRVNEYYFFDNGYKVDTENLDNIIKNNDSLSLPSNFFYSKNNNNSSLENINIQAIAGKNGDGKTTLIELILRILNNFFKEYRIGNVTQNLLFVTGVNADLFFVKNDRIYRISVNSKEIYKITEENIHISIKFFENNKLIFNSEDYYQQIVRSQEIIDIENLFFTMYINYSIYGLDENDYSDETFGDLNSIYNDDTRSNSNLLKSSWLSQIFHKNDGYQTPIVIHPFRQDAQINIRNEKYLMDQRLISLIFEEENFSITDDLTVDKLLLRRKQDSLTYFIDDFLNQYQEYDEYYKVEHILKEKYGTRKKSETIRRIEAYYNFLLQNASLLRKFKEKNSYGSNVGDLQKITLILFGQVFDKIKFPDGDDGLSEIFNAIYNPKSDKDKIDSELLRKMKYIYDSTTGLNFICFNLFQILTIYYNFWNEHFYYAHLKTNLEKELFNYCVVKSYKTIRYPKYNSLNRIDTIEHFSANFNLNKQVTEIAHKEFLVNLIEDSSHISLKLRQCITLLNLAKDNKGSELVNFYDRYDKKASQSVNVPHLNSLITKISSAYDMDRLLLLPPSIFNIDIYLKSVDREVTDISIRKLSSGEYQKISVISSIIYHLKNLDSITARAATESKNNKIFKFTPIYNFENVNIILDEIELYFHPEFQRMFIKEILDRINHIEFERIKSINILFITHSPFILSDIPKNNVLFLENGNPVFPMVENTFAANIHTLLQHGFFLNSVPIGEFSKDKINKIFSILHNKSKYEFKDDLLETIMLVSEPFIKSQLLKLYNDQRPDIKALEDRINLLSEELLKIKRDNAEN